LLLRKRAPSAPSSGFIAFIRRLKTNFSGKKTRDLQCAELRKARKGVRVDGWQLTRLRRNVVAMISMALMQLASCYLFSALLESVPSSKIGSYLMAKKAVKRREWTSTDVETLRSLARKQTHAGRIAKTLKRTEGATRQKAFSIGVSLDSR
jgi:hypothetical protein